jgi:tripartite-type tricarboxylate transporter receptor subunit TctC
VVPIVFPSAGDPVGNKLVHSLARPGGNVTGLSVQSSELAQKVVERFAHQSRQAAPLAVTASTRWEGLPDIPTVGDFVPGFETNAWAGIGAPKDTPAEIIDKLNKAINAALADPKIKARLADLGGSVVALSPAEYGKRITDETEKWGKVIRAANIKPE